MERQRAVIQRQRGGGATEGVRTLRGRERGTDRGIERHCGAAAGRPTAGPIGTTERLHAGVRRYRILLIAGGCIRFTPPLLWLMLCDCHYSFAFTICRLRRSTAECFVAADWRCRFCAVVRPAICSYQYEHSLPIQSASTVAACLPRGAGLSPLSALMMQTASQHHANTPALCDESTLVSDMCF